MNGLGEVDFDTLVIQNSDRDLAKCAVWYPDQREYHDEYCSVMIVRKKRNKLFGKCSL